MRELMNLVSDIAPLVKIGWLIFFVWALGQIAWYRRAHVVTWPRIAAREAAAPEGRTADRQARRPAPADAAPTSAPAPEPPAPMAATAADAAKPDARAARQLAGVAPPPLLATDDAARAS